MSILARRRTSLAGVLINDVIAKVGPGTRLGDLSEFRGTLLAELVSYFVMRMRWRFVLPVFGLLAFCAESYLSLRMNQEFGMAPHRYYWWSSIRLDTEPLNKNPACKSGEEDCGWEPSQIWIDPGYLMKSLMLAALPAFALGAITVGGLGRLGVNEVWSFFVSMPLFIVSWFYFVGWVIDWWLHKRRKIVETPDYRALLPSSRHPLSGSLAAASYVS